MNTFRVMTADEALRRAMEKEEIRRQILTGDIIRRRQLEEEVMRELAVEEAFRISMQRHLPTPNSFQEQLNPSVVDDTIGEEINPSSQINKDKVIILPRPDPDLLGSKRKAVTPAETEPNTFGLSKKAKKEWRCELCQVDATSESQLNSHLSGRKHKAKETALRKMDNSTETSLLSKENVQGVKTTETSLLSKENVEGLKATETLGDINGTVVENGVMADDSIGASELQLPQIVTPVEIKPSPQIDMVMADDSIGAPQLELPQIVTPVEIKPSPQIDMVMADDSIGASQLELPQIVTPVEIKPSPQIDMDKAITLAKCDPADIHDAKGKAVELAVNTTSSSEVSLMMKKLLEELNCAICGIYTTCKRNMNEHLNSKKHKAKEAALLRNQQVLKTAEIILVASPRLDPEILAQFPQPSLSSEELNDTTVDEAGVEESDEILANPNLIGLCQKGKK